MPYLFLFVASIFFSYFIRLNYFQTMNGCIKRTFSHDYDFLVMFTLIIVFTLFFGLRYNVGIDYMAYYNNAEFSLWNKPQKGTGQYFEPAFRALYALSDFFCLPSNTIFVLSGFLIYVFLFAGIRSYSVSFPLSLFIFISSGLFYFSFNEMRQFVAVCIVFYGYSFCIRRNFFKWILTVLFAMSFHKSAFIIFPVYFLSIIKMNRTFLNCVIVITPLLKKIGMLNILCEILSYLPGHYSDYAETLLWMKKNVGAGIIGYMYFLIIAFLNNIRFRKEIFSDNEKNCFMNIFILGAVFTVLFSEIYMVTRFMEFFLISIVVVFPVFIKLAKKRMLYYIFAILTMIIFGMNFLKYSFFSPESSLLSYHTVFSR